MRVWSVLAVIVILLMVLNVGCNTMRGAGRDIQRLGEKIEETAH
mgnify:CR=1 FL=1